MRQFANYLIFYYICQDIKNTMKKLFVQNWQIILLIGLLKKILFHWIALIKKFKIQLIFFKLDSYKNLAFLN